MPGEDPNGTRLGINGNDPQVGLAPAVAWQSRFGNAPLPLRIVDGLGECQPAEAARDRFRSAGKQLSPGQSQQV